MARNVQAIKGGKLTLTDNVEEIYEKRVTPYGNGAKIDSQKKTHRKTGICHNPR